MIDSPTTAATVARTARDQLPLAVGSAVLATLVVTAPGDDGLILCPFRRCTGGYCPGCGGTRAARNLLHGNVSGAWGHNPWVVLAAAQLIVLAGILAFVHPAVRITRLRRLAIPLLAVNTIALIAIWIVRLHDGSIPTGWL